MHQMKTINANMLPKRLFVILMTVMLCGSCEKDFLEDKLLSDTSVEFLYSSPEGLESAVVGLYSLNRTIYEDNRLNGTIPGAWAASTSTGTFRLSTSRTIRAIGITTPVWLVM